MLLRSLAALTRSIGAALLVGTVAICAPMASAEKYAAIVVDADTQEVLHSRNADDPRYPASLTKVMTLYMLFDALKSGELSLNDKLTVSRYAASMAPSNLKLKVNSKITVEDAIDALVTKSANDVAVVVAERLGGTETRFAKLMTAKAQSLGLENTRFVNASGLPDTRQLTTARDLALLAQAMLTDQADYYHYFATAQFTYAGKTYKNHNELLGKVDGVDGIKTGYTRASGFNLMASAVRGDHRVIAVMLGGSTARSRDSHVESLMEAAFDAFAMPMDADDPGLRTRLAFASLDKPLPVNAAAEPMLNGKPLSAYLTKGPAEEGIVAEADATAQGDTDEMAVAGLVTADAPMAEDAAEVDVAEAVAEIVETREVSSEVDTADMLDINVETAEVAAEPEAEPVAVAAPAPELTLSISEYEARQLGK